MKKNNTSWEKSASWYNSLVGDKGHYYHQKVIVPALMNELQLEAFDHPKVLDLGCGNGFLAQVLPKKIDYLGIDASLSLIQKASKHFPDRAFLHKDVTKPLHLKKEFTHCVFLLSLQNMEESQEALKQASLALCEKGVLILVLNHPCFRIPRQSHWSIDEKKKIQYRRIDHYLTPLKIPIVMDPGSKQKTTYSFHTSLNDLSWSLEQNHFMIQRLQELMSDKVSTGKAAKMENRARKEIPLFLMLKARKIVV